MNKEIEALSEIIGSCNTRCDHPFDCSHCKAFRVYDAGYRKSADVVEEIFEEIERLLDKHIIKVKYTDGLSTLVFKRTLEVDLFELRKKYESEGTDDANTNI